MRYEELFNKNPGEQVIGLVSLTYKMKPSDVESLGIKDLTRMTAYSKEHIKRIEQANPNGIQEI